MQQIEEMNEEAARAAYQQVCAVLGAEPYPLTVEQGGAVPWPDGRPVLCRNFTTWYEPTPWAVVWEGGPYDWAVEVSFDERLTSGTVLFEPINGFALAICPD